MTRRKPGAICERISSDPFARPFDRAILTIRREFGHNAAVPVYGESFHAQSYQSVCPLHPVPDCRPLMTRERGGHGGELLFSCEGDCLPSMILHELRSLERWQLLREAIHGHEESSA